MRSTWQWIREIFHETALTFSAGGTSFRGQSSGAQLASTGDSSPSKSIQNHRAPPANPPAAPRPMPACQPKPSVSLIQGVIQGETMPPALPPVLKMPAEHRQPSAHFNRGDPKGAFGQPENPQGQREQGHDPHGLGDHGAPQHQQRGARPMEAIAR